MSTPTMRCEVFPFVDARTGAAHLVASDAVDSGRRAGRYVAVCGAGLLAGSLTAEEKRYCLCCLDWRRVNVRNEGTTHAEPRPRWWRDLARLFTHRLRTSTRTPARAGGGSGTGRGLSIAIRARARFTGN